MLGGITVRDYPHRVPTLRAMGRQETARCATTGLEHGAAVHLYRNLRSSGVVWSVRHRGRVAARVGRVAVVDAVFRVQPSGAARARREGRRNVHAYVAGTLADPSALPTRGWVAVSYHPFALPDAFQRRDTGATVARADAVVVDADGCWALCPRP